MRKIFWVALCWLASVTWAHAAPQVLFLSPDESKPVGRPVSQADWSFTNNAYNAFSAQVGAANIHDGRRVLDSASPDLTLFNGVQLVVITTTYAVISPQWQAELRTLMLNRPDLTFVFYPDGCCNSGQNLTPIVDIIKTGTSWGVSVTGTNVAGAVNAALNTNSLYKGSFAGLPTMVGATTSWCTECRPTTPCTSRMQRRSRQLAPRRLSMHMASLCLNRVSMAAMGHASF